MKKIARKFDRRFYFKLVGIIVFVALMGVLGDKIATSFNLINAKVQGLLGWISGGIALLAYISADFASGMVHFICDNYGSEETPLIGHHFIKEFRLHHGDPQDIARHGFVETNGNNSLVSIPVLICTLLFVQMSNLIGYIAALYIFILMAGVFATNQIHKWAHTPNISGFPVLLQKMKLILSPENHQVHHRSPYDKYYCITTGWLNKLLLRIGFFELILKLFPYKHGQ